MRIRSLVFCAGLLVAARLVSAGEAAPAPAAAPGPQKFVQEGLAVELSLERVDGNKHAPVMEGETARVTLAIQDATTGTPVPNLYPGAWMDRLKKDKEEGSTCQKKVEAFIGGSILSRPELDLNVYYVLSLNQDATISVVDPLFGYGNSKLLSMVFLKSPGEDWALTADGSRLFVSLPDSNRVAVVESANWKVVLEVGTPARPRRVGLQPDGQYLWVAYEGTGPWAESGVTVIDTRGLRKVADVKTGKGAHDLAFSDDSRFAFVTNEGDGTVSVIDVGQLAKVRDVKVGKAPVSIAWSTQAKAAWVTALDGTISVVDAASAEPRARMQASPGLGQIRFTPDGRLAFIVQPNKNEVHIADVASSRIVQTADVEAEPDQVAFSSELAYIRHRKSETVLMIPLKTVGDPNRVVSIVDFPGGEHPPGRLPLPTPAAGIVQAPGATAVLVSNPEDKVIYYYKEGMAAPMGHFQNYGKQPRAVLVVDRSLREVRPGVYETITRMGPPGEYDLALYVNSPKVIHCFPVKVAANPTLAEKRKKERALDVEFRVGRHEVAKGEEVAVRFRLTDPVTGEPRTGLKDVRALAFLTPGIWQQRHWATELKDGVYEFRFSPPDPGVYYVFVESASAGLLLQKSPYLTLEAKEGAAPNKEASVNRP
ncbi:MAG TPA: YncE family protein [Thermoanaerobaculia bacterium]